MRQHSFLRQMKEAFLSLDASKLLSVKLLTDGWLSFARNI